ncbi:MAG: GtrA family protein [Beijerinckiaceae bacterium]
MTDPAPDANRLPIRQMALFYGVGIAAAVVHYGTMIGLVEWAGWRPVQATLAGYVTGGITSYALNRWLTYATQRSHAEAGWRFALVAGVGFLLTWGLMYFFTEIMPLRRYYILMQILTTQLVMVWSFAAHKFFTFGEARSERRP